MNLLLSLAAPPGFTSNDPAGRPIWTP